MKMNGGAGANDDDKNNIAENTLLPPTHTSDNHTHTPDPAPHSQKTKPEKSFGPRTEKTNFSASKPFGSENGASEQKTAPDTGFKSDTGDSITGDSVTGSSLTGDSSQASRKRRSRRHSRRRKKALLLAQQAQEGGEDGNGIVGAMSGGPGRGPDPYGGVGMNGSASSRMGKYPVDGGKYPSHHGSHHGQKYHAPRPGETNFRGGREGGTQSGGPAHRAQRTRNLDSLRNTGGDPNSQYSKLLIFHSG